MLSDLIAKLQSKPYQTRVKILWGIVLVCSVLIVVLWGFNLQKTISRIDGVDLNPLDDDAQAIVQNSEYVKVERVEITDDIVRVYFNVENPTDDILTFSKLSDVRLIAKEKIISPEQITDRQGRPFVQKILSRTQNFGIVDFKAVEEKSGELFFENLSFEQNQKTIFKEKVELNFEKLKKDQELRG